MFEVEGIFFGYFYFVLPLNIHQASHEIKIDYKHRVGEKKKNSGKPEFYKIIFLGNNLKAMNIYHIIA